MAARRSPWAGTRRMASSSAAGPGTTRGCWSTSSRSARRRYPRRRACGGNGRRPTRNAGAEAARSPPPRFRADVRPPVLARLDRLPRHPGRLHARARLRLFREQPSRDLRAARVRDRQPDGLERLSAKTSGASPRATARPAPRRITSARRALPPLLRARRRSSPTAFDDGTIAPTAAARVAAVRARDRHPGVDEMHDQLGRDLFDATASSTRSTRASPTTCR